MSDQKTNSTPETKGKGKSQPVANPDLKTLSAQASLELHTMLDTACKEYRCDKATLIRACAMFFIVTFGGDGFNWETSEELDTLLVFAGDPYRVQSVLKILKSGA